MMRNLSEDEKQRLVQYIEKYYKMRKKFCAWSQLIPKYLKKKFFLEKYKKFFRVFFCWGWGEGCSACHWKIWPYNMGVLCNMKLGLFDMRNALCNLDCAMKYRCTMIMSLLMWVLYDKSCHRLSLAKHIERKRWKKRMPFARMIRTNGWAQQVSLYIKLVHFPHL